MTNYIVGQANYTQKDNDFRVNLWLDSVRKEYLHTENIDWSAVSPELKEEINKLTYQIKKCLDLSNAICKHDNS